MNEQFVKIVNKINRISSRLFAPVLGKIGFYKEKRISIELNKDSITICRVNVKKKIITHLFNRSFDLTDPETNLEKKPKFYSDEIAEILAKEKLLGFEANIIIPTADVSIKSMSVPIMDQDIMDQQVKNPEFWKQFGDLPDDMNDKTIFHQIINSNKVTNMHDVLLIFTDKKKFENLNIILKNAGLNPTLYEPKCFSILNTIFAIQKNKEPKPFAFLEYGEKENYFALCSKSKLIFYENPIRKEDLVLIKQMAKLTDITGPFWGEVFDRHLQVVKAGLSEVKGIKEFEIKEVYVHTEFSESKNFINGLQEKLTDVTFKELTVFDQDVSKLKKSKNTMKLKLFKFDKQTEERIKSSHG
jgi:type IV pilus assembly protein PilN